MSDIFDAGRITRAGNCVTWNIDSCLCLSLDEDSEIRSKEFQYGNSRYTLGVWPRGKIGRASYKWFGICLYNYSASGNSCLSSVQFSIVSGDKDIKTCTVKRSESNNFWHSCLKFMKWSDFSENIDYIAPNGCLTIECRFYTDTDQQFSKESDRKITHPMNNPPVKYQLGEYSLPEPCSSEISSCALLLRRKFHHTMLLVLTMALPLLSIRFIVHHMSRSPINLHQNQSKHKIQRCLLMLMMIILNQLKQKPQISRPPMMLRKHLQVSKTLPKLQIVLKLRVTPIHVEEPPIRLPRPQFGESYFSAVPPSKIQIQWVNLLKN